MAGYGKNGNSNGVMERRRRLISSMLLRRPNITRREVMKNLADVPLLNPATNEPFALGTIQNDIDALKAGWRERSDENTDEWIAELLAMIDQLQGDAWQEREYAVVLRCVQERAKLKGLYPAEKRELTGAGGGPLAIEHEFDPSTIREALAILGSQNSCKGCRD